MRQLKRVLAALLAGVLLLALLPAAALAADGGEDAPLTVTAVPTGVEAEGVFITEGYGSLSRGGEENPAFALMGGDGQLVFDYGDFPCAFRLSGGLFVNGLPESQTYSLFNLAGEQVLAGSWPYLTFQNGYGVALTPEYGPGGQTAERVLIDGTGQTVFALPDGFNLPIGISGQPNPFANSSWEERYFGELGGYGEGLLPLFTASGVQDSIFEAQGLTADSPVFQEKGYEMFCWGGPYCGYIDLEGRVVIPLQFYRVKPFSCGLAAVQEYVAPTVPVEELPEGASLGGYWKYIDPTGADAFGRARYTDASAFTADGYAFIANETGQYGYIDTTGQVVIPLIYDSAFGAGDGLFTVGRYVDGRMQYGAVDLERREVVPLEYDDITSFENGRAYGIKDGQVWLLTVDDPAQPEDSLTRAELARMVYEKFRPAPLPPEGETPRTEDFPDIGPVEEGEDDPCTDAQREAISALYSAYILDGLSEGIFLPHGTVTRAEGVVLLWRAAGRGTADGAPEEIFNNVPENLKPAFDYLTALGVLDGSDGTDGAFDLTGLLDRDTLERWLSRLVTRAEAAQLLFDTLALPPAQGEGDFGDLGSCTDGQRTAIAALAELGILDGVAPGRFAPNLPVTLGMTAVVMCRVVSGDYQVSGLELALLYLQGKGLLQPEEIALIAARPGAAVQPEQISQWMERRPTGPEVQELGLIAGEEGRVAVELALPDEVVAEQRPALLAARYENGRMTGIVTVYPERSGLTLLDLSGGTGTEYRVFLLDGESSPLCPAAGQQ